jgi:hypothetical protein
MNFNKIASRLASGLPSNYEAVLQEIKDLQNRKGFSFLDKIHELYEVIADFTEGDTDNFTPSDLKKFSGWDINAFTRLLNDLGKGDGSDALGWVGTIEEKIQDILKGREQDRDY